MVNLKRTYLPVSNATIQKQSTLSYQPSKRLRSQQLSPEDVFEFDAAFNTSSSIGWQKTLIAL